jgi:hypothetical protein
VAVRTHNDTTGLLVTRRRCVQPLTARCTCFIITTFLTVLALNTLVAADARAAATPPDPGESAANAMTLKFHEPYAGALDRLRDADVFAIPPAVVLSVVRVKVEHTNAVCEVWAGSLDRTGTEVNHVFVARDVGVARNCVGAREYDLCKRLSRTGSTVLRRDLLDSDEHPTCASPECGARPDRTDSRIWRRASVADGRAHVSDVLQRCGKDRDTYPTTTSETDESARAPPTKASAELTSSTGCLPALPRFRAQALRPSSAMTKSGARASSDLTAALIAAAFGVIGVLAGALVTFVTTRAVQNRDISRQEDLTRRAAKTAAVVEQFRFQHVSEQVGVIIHTRRRDSIASGRSRLSTADLATMLAYLDSRTAGAYAKADFCVTQLPKSLSIGSADENVSRDVVAGLQALNVDEGQRALRALVDG